jgi:DNA replication protein DnaC
VEVPNPIQKMEINGQVICPRCETEKETHVLVDEYSEFVKKVKAAEKYNVLYYDSIVDDQTILEARFSNFIANEPEEIRNRQLVCDYLQDYREGKIFTLVMQGYPGTGKSHLSYSLLYELNESRDKTCLYVSLEAMIRKIYDSFRNKQSKFTEDYFNQLLASVDFLVLDD